ncbi:hypothetical protein AT959_19290 [Dechloromonas denitrificans]|uniref:Uncharacterized protein n=1 Tax=Dechloromonas denitrificans TaxID=281362 RepID=A0A133XDF6_9RHOO|nr:hypothetical protein [Dechloromonas denitrificans]KXB28971.1 hypothetical protein AT959_19290 [Dechloromonas denitrificans]
MKVVEILPLSDAVVGLRLAAAVLDEAGHVLVPAGAELSESILQGLQRREIAEISVEHDVEEDPAAQAAYRAKLAAQLDHIFRKAGDGDETRALYQAVLDYRMEHRS